MSKTLSTEKVASVPSEVELLRAVVKALPKCQCGRVAIGYHTTHQRVIGRKMYGGNPIPSCGICPPEVWYPPIILYPYSPAVADYNARWREFGEDPAIQVSVDTPALQG